MRSQLELRLEMVRLGKSSVATIINNMQMVSAEEKKAVRYFFLEMQRVTLAMENTMATGMKNSQGLVLILWERCGM